MPTLVSLLSSLAWPLVRKVLIALGIGLATYGGISSLLDSLLAQAASYYSGMPSYIATVCAMGGIPTGLGILTGALTTRVSMMVTKRFILK